MTKRGWLAWAVSLAGHGLLVFGVCRYFVFAPHSPVSPKPVNRVIEAPIDYGSVSISFVEELKPSEPVSNSQTVAAPVQSPEKRDGAPRSMANRNQGNPIEPRPEQGPQPSGLAQPGHPVPGVAPLHGKIAQPGTSIVYVLDVSGSMARERKLQRAIGMLKASLRQLGPDVRFQVVTYDSQATISRIGGSSELVKASEASLTQADAILDRLIGEGSSRHVEGLIAGLGLHSDVLILLTDADELLPTDMTRIKQWNKKGTAIHAVLFGTASVGKSPLQDVVGKDRLHYLR